MVAEFVSRVGEGTGVDALISPQSKRPRSSFRKTGVMILATNYSRVTTGETTIDERGLNERVRDENVCVATPIITRVVAHADSRRVIKARIFYPASAVEWFARYYEPGRGCGVESDV